MEHVQLCIAIGAHKALDCIKSSLFLKKQSNWPHKTVYKFFQVLLVAFFPRNDTCFRSRNDSASTKGDESKII